MSGHSNRAHQSSKTPARPRPAGPVGPFHRQILPKVHVEPGTSNEQPDNDASKSRET